MSRPKIFYNLENSTYTVETENLIFYFSSLLYMCKFKDRLKDNRGELGYKFTSRYNIVFDSNEYFDVILYTQIEKRGFRIFNKNKGENWKWLKEVKFVGQMSANKN